MVRPKVSEANLQVALAFADVLVSREMRSKSDLLGYRVICKGVCSLFAAFRACFPELTRETRDKHPKNRNGISIIELNKALKLSGLRTLRKRAHTGDGVKWVYKVTRIAEVICVISRISTKSNIYEPIPIEIFKVKINIQV